MCKLLSTQSYVFYIFRFISEYTHSDYPSYNYALLCFATFSRERGGIHPDRNYSHFPVSRILLSCSVRPLCGRLFSKLPHSSCFSGVHWSHLHHRWDRRRSHKSGFSAPTVVSLRQHICLCVNICVYQALFSHIPGPLHTQWQQQVAPLQRPDSSCPVWGALLQSLLRPPPTGCQSTPTEKSTGKCVLLLNS